MKGGLDNVTSALANQKMDDKLIRAGQAKLVKGIGGIEQNEVVRSFLGRINKRNTSKNKLANTRSKAERRICGSNV